jgi:hypothetical protein
MPPSGIIALLLLARMAWRGYQRRRLVWTRRSWQGFGLALASCVASFVVAMSMVGGVDAGIYDGMSPASRRLYFVTTMTLTIASPLATSALVLWFANGRPDRQFGRRRERITSSPLTSR